MVPDILVVGAGVFGLSVAEAAHRAGLTVRVLEADRPGGGASGGFVGALTPHAPTRWRPMMAFQFAALNRLGDHVQRLGEQSGIDTGYARIGRWTPIASERALNRAEADVEAAPLVWGAHGSMRIEPPDACPEVSGAAARYGFLFDDFSARISPRAYLSALAAALPRGSVETGRVLSVESGPVVRTEKDEFSAGHVVVAAGWRGWALLPEALRGMGVKGQAALLSGAPPDLPMITCDGLYIVPHADGTVAVGSTSEKRWTDPEPDGALEGVIARACAAVPALAGAKVIERWAGIRPKPPGREPVVGPVPGMPGIWLAGGGFKIGFGIAHAVGEAIVAAITGHPAPIPVPDTFTPACHIPGRASR